MGVMPDRYGLDNEQSRYYLRHVLNFKVHDMARLPHWHLPKFTTLLCSTGSYLKAGISVAAMTLPTP